MKRFLKWLVLTVVALSTVYGLIELAIWRHYYPGPPDADYPEPGSVLEARQQDLDYFRQFLELDRSYTSVTRLAAEALLAGMEPGLEDLSDAGFQLGIARAVAAADNGHTNIWLGRFSREHGRLPVRFYWFADGIRVVGADGAHADLLGAELLSVGGVPVLEAAVRLKDFHGGSWEGYRAYRGPMFLELPVAHHAAGLSDSPDATTLTFRLSDGSLVVRRVQSESLDEDAALFWPDRYLMEALPGESRPGWARLVSRIDNLPLYLREPELEFRTAPLPGNGLYVQYRANVGEGIEALGDTVRQLLDEQAPAFLVLDQRFNGGGDYTLTAGLMNDLPRLLGESVPIYVITGPSTFSAGISSVAFIRAAGPDQVVLVGERVGDRERNYGETNDFELPNSRLGMTFNTGLHDYANGCPPFPECYARNYFHDVAVGSLDPDVLVETSFQDYLAGIDPVLEWVLARQSQSQ